MKTSASLCVWFAVCFSAVAMAQNAPDSNQIHEDDLASPRNWAVDFPSLTAGQGDPSGQKVALAVVLPAASHFITMVPCRVVDTRNPDGPYGGPKLTQAGTRRFDINDGPCSGIPVNASGYSISISSAGSHSITMVPCLVPRPSTVWRNLS